ncbi:MAG: hypothetical protein KGH87_02245 [Thaumarchaeota archaeon]|nr:hypothetical protein [Nitrososphaerota archaeon]MDE1838719.1 hypothetical protein [Nitrososphaerota archaeon]
MSIILLDLAIITVFAHVCYVEKITFESLYRIGFILGWNGIPVIKQLVIFLVEKWWACKGVNKRRGLEQIHYEPLIIEDSWISFGYVRHGESISDLQ